MSTANVSDPGFASACYGELPFADDRTFWVVIEHPIMGFTVQLPHDLGECGGTTGFVKTAGDPRFRAKRHELVKKGGFVSTASTTLTSPSLFLGECVAANAKTCK